MTTAGEVAAGGSGPVQVVGEVLSSKRIGAHHLVTLVAPGVPERFRPGTMVALGLGGALSSRVVPATYPIHRVRATGAYGGTVEVVLTLTGAGPDADAASTWLASAPAGTPVPVTGPLGRPFALPKEAVTCLLVGEAGAAAPLFPLAERLRERGCAVHMLLGAAGEPQLFGALEARRATRGVTVVTRDGSVGIAGTLATTLPDVLTRTGADVVYAAGPTRTLHQVAAAAEAHGSWSQVLLVDVPMPCGTGLCGGCVLPMVGEDGLTRMARVCADGPVVRGDRVRWADLGTVPEGAR